MKSVALFREELKFVETSAANSGGVAAAAAELAASVVEEAFDAIVGAGRGVVDANRMPAAFRIKVFVCENRRAVYDVHEREARFLERSPWALCCAGVEEN